MPLADERRAERQLQATEVPEDTEDTEKNSTR